MTLAYHNGSTRLSISDQSINALTLLDVVNQHCLSSAPVVLSAHVQGVGARTMTINTSDRTDDELKNLIDNHRKRDATDRPLYLEALRELERRKGKGLDFEKSFEVIRKAAEERRFLSYGELAQESGAEWNKVHYAIGNHLWSLVEYAHRNGWPLLSAIVVNKSNVETGTMEPDTLKGFINAARELGYAVTNEIKFLREQQEAVFAWAQEITIPPHGAPPELSADESGIDPRHRS